MKTIAVTELTDAQKAAVMQLWNREYPAQLSYQKPEDFERYLNGLSNKEHLLLIDDTEKVFGWAIAFDRERERWFAIIVDSAVQGAGYGSMLLHATRARNTKLAGWVIDHERYKRSNGEPYRSPLNFYLKNGFVIKSDSRLELEHLSAVRIEWH